MGYEIPALIGGLIIGALLVYVLLAQRSKQQARNIYSEWMTTGRMQIEKEAEQKAEQKYTQIGSATLAAWKATELQSVREENQREIQRVREEDQKSLRELEKKTRRNARVRWILREMFSKAKSENRWLLCFLSLGIYTIPLMPDSSELLLTISSSRI